jgi:hypothetical protein
MMHTHQKCQTFRSFGTRSGPSRRLLPSSFPGLLRAPVSAQNPVKIGPKSDHPKLINGSAPTIYNFDGSRRSDFRRQGISSLQAKPVQNLYVCCTKRWGWCTSFLKPTRSDPFSDRKIARTYCTSLYPPPFCDFASLLLVIGVNSCRFVVGFPKLSTK